VPGHRPWQKELKAKWAELAAAKYDWAHLAMHLWPERVVPKCATDRSLAIAHGLEDVFWEETGDAKWRARPRPMSFRSVESEVTATTGSPASARPSGAYEQASGPELDLPALRPSPQGWPLLRH